MWFTTPILKRLDTIEVKIDALTRRVLRLEERLDGLRDEVREVRFMVNRPREVSVKVVEEEVMAIRFAVVLPVPPAVASDWAEIAKGELRVVIPEQDPIVIETDKAAQLTPDRLVLDDRFVGPQGTVVGASFCYIDDAGNRGPLVEAWQELLDTVPPVGPDALGIVAVEEIPDPPTPEPQPEPPIE